MKLKLFIPLLLGMLCTYSQFSYGDKDQSRHSDRGYGSQYRQNNNYGEEFGQTVKDASVRNRARPEYDPVGGRHRGFVYYPYASAGLLFDDNVFSATTEQDDTIIKTEAGLKIDSDWGRHALTFQFDLEDFRHDQFQSEDRTNLAGSVKGRYDIYHDAALYGLFAVTKFHESRGSGSALDSNTAAEPTPYTLIKAASYLEKTVGRVKLQVSGGVEHFDYEDVAAVGGGTLDQDVRDGYVFKGGLRKSYNFSPGYNVFGLVEGNHRDFRGGNGSPNRDSDGVEARVGLEFEMTRLMAGEFSVGYMYQDYENSTFDDVSEFAYKGALLWNPTRLMTVTVDATRVISETTVTSASGRVDSKLAVKVDYEILRNLLGSVKGEYLFEDYKGVTREDETIVSGVSLDYLINRRLRTNFYYTYQKRDSNTATFNYEKNVVGGALKVQF